MIIMESLLNLCIIYDSMADNIENDIRQEDKEQQIKRSEYCPVQRDSDLIFELNILLFNRYCVFLGLFFF